MTSSDNVQRVVIIDAYGPESVHGPFDTLEAAQAFKAEIVAALNVRVTIRKIRPTTLEAYGEALREWRTRHPELARSQQLLDALVTIDESGR